MRDWIVDVAIVVVAVCSGVFVLGSTWEAHSDAVKVLDIALGSVACVALFWRRSHPLGVALLIVPLSAVSALAAMATLPAVFNAAIRVPLRALAGVVALAVAGTAIFPLLYPEVDGRGYGWQLTVGLLLTAVALGWGLFVRAQRELFKGIRERGQEKAREAERRRIAREMHDVLAHRLSILSVHAGALENAGDRLPPEYAETAKVIRTSARTALEELREVIGLLRQEETSAVEPPQPTLDQLPALLEESRAAGLTVNYEPQRTTVPDLVGRTAYRAIQEGLTNARKHGAGDTVRLTIDNGPPLVVELTSHGQRAGDAAGHRDRARRPRRAGRAGRRRADLRPARRHVHPAGEAAVVIRVLLVDDDPLLRSGLKLMLAPEAEIEVVAEAGDGDEVLAAIDRHRPDVVLMDIRMPRVDGIAATRLIRQQPQAPNVIVLTTFDADELVVRGLEAGALGFLLKDSSPAEIVKAIKDVHAGDGTLSPSVARQLIGAGGGRRRGGRQARTRARPARAAEPARARRGRGDRPRRLQRRDRERAAHQRRDREVPHDAAAGQARRREPRAGRATGHGSAVASSRPSTTPGGTATYSHQGWSMLAADDADQRPDREVDERDRRPHDGGDAQRDLSVLRHRTLPCIGG